MLSWDLVTVSGIVVVVVVLIVVMVVLVVGRRGHDGRCGVPIAVWRS